MPASLAFTNLSLSIGTGIASAALVARNLGARQPERAREFATSCLIYAMGLSLCLTIILAVSADGLLRLLGAQGEALRLATLFIWTMTPGFVFIAGGVSCSFALRGIGDARRAMYVTLWGAIVTAILDPLFILGLGWGIQGAAVANVIAYFVCFMVGLYGLVRVHRFLAPITWQGLKRDLGPISTIAIPAMLTQLATPFGNAYITREIAPFGDEAVSGWAIIGRLIPVAFGIIFSLSGSVGPVIGQNFGAREFARVRRTLSDGLIFASIYTLLTSLLLFVFRHEIAALFQASGETRHLIVFFCTYIAVSWAFAGAQFVANAAFNNLGHPNTSTIFNWAKATIGTIPFAIYGAALGGAYGVLVGTAIGSVIFGLASTLWAYRIAMMIERRG